MWNSNLPKMDGIYFFGSYESKQLTFFRGEDVLPSEERKLLLEFWNELDEKEKEWTEKYRNKIESGEIKNAYGFEPYIRKAYEQTKHYNSDAITDFYSNSNKSDLEAKVIEFVENTDK